MTTQDKKLAAALHDLGLLGDTLIKRDEDVKALRARLAEAEGLIARFEAQAKRHDAHARNCGFYFHGFFANHAKRRAFLEGSQEVSQ